MAKTNEYEYDMKGLKEAQAEAESVKTNREKATTHWEAIKRMVFEEWEERPGSPEIKVTVSPGPRNKVQGLRNLLASTSPQFNVPRDKNNADAERVSSTLEHAANTMWNSANRVQGKRTEADMATSAAIYDEIHLDIVSTEDRLKATEEAHEEAKKESDYDDFEEARWQSKIEKAKSILSRTPYLFPIANPEVVCPVWSREGEGTLARFSEVEMYVSDVRSLYGKRAVKALSVVSKKDYDTVVVCTWLDGAYKFVWIQGAEGEPIYAETHGLKFMPFVSYRVTGTDFFTEMEHTNEPFLYGVYKSGLWQAQNVMLTAARTAMFGIGLNAQMYYQKADDQDQLAPVDHTIVGGVLQGRGNLRPLMTDIITKDFTALWQVLDGMFEESTIYGSALGEKLSSNMTFSETALLAQQGRLPIVPIQKAMEEAAAQAMNIAFMWLRMAKKDYGLLGSMKLSEIPQVVEFEVSVEPDLPQDKVQAGQVAAGLVGGQDPVMSKAWGRELLGEGQSDEMQKSIWTEQMSSMAFQQGAGPTLEMALQAAGALTKMVSPKPNAGPPIPAEMPQESPAGMMAKPETMPANQRPPGELPDMMPEGM